jgi:hypothetical protein
MLPAGSVQRMTLGSGAWHSEQNGSDTEPLRFIQMWIMPAERGLPPGVEQKVFSEEDRKGRLLKVISGDDGDAVQVHQDASVFVSHLEPGTKVEHTFAPGHGGYLYVIDGSVRLKDEKLGTGDAAKIAGEPNITIEADGPTELILVDVTLEGLTSG